MCILYIVKNVFVFYFIAIMAKQHYGPLINPGLAIQVWERTTPRVSPCGP